MDLIEKALATVVTRAFSMVVEEGFEPPTQGFSELSLQNIT